MQTIKLFPDVPRQAVELVTPRDLDHNCTRCPMSKRFGLKTVCMSADGTPGGLLVVSDYPSNEEDSIGRPFMSAAGKALRATIKELWPGPVVFDNAVKCSPGSAADYGSKAGMHDSAPEQCRGHLAGILRDAAPVRILALGSRALEGLLGRAPPIMSVRRGYAHLSTGVPIVYSFNPVAGVHNKHLRKQLREDLQWALQPNLPLKTHWHATAQVVTNYEDALEAVAILRRSEWFAFDLESAGIQFSAYQILTCALFPAGSDEGFVWTPEAMADPRAAGLLGDLLADKRIGKTGNNLKFDFLGATVELGKTPQNLRGDNRLMRKVVDTDSDGHLEVLAERVGMGGHKGESKKGMELAVLKVRKEQVSDKSSQMSLIPRDRGFLRDDVHALMVKSAHEEPKAFAYGYMPRETLLRYVCRDSLTSRLLQEQGEAELAQEPPHLQRVWTGIVRPAVEAVRQVEQWGMAVDRGAIANFTTYLQSRQSELLAKMMQWGKFDPGNPHSVGPHLFEKLGLKGGQRTAKSGQWSTDAETLEQVAARNGKHPLPQMIIDYKSYEKLLGTNAIGVERCIRGDGRIHPTLLLDGARSGRLSCQNPNLQNVPRDADTAEGKMARDCFVAPYGYTLLSVDYSQLELRIAAALSGDQEMAAIFARGEDFHLATAKLIAPIVWGIKPEQVEKKHRTAAKTFNFGIMYGMSDEGIALKAGCSIAEAQKIREAVMGKFHKLAAWISGQIRYAKQHGICWTWWDGDRARRRPLYDIASASSLERSNSENASFNTPVQGTGSDFCLMSLVECVRWLREDAVPAKLVLPIHDALLFEVRNDALEEVAYNARRIMTGFNSNGVDLTVDMDTGPAWGSLKKYELAA